MCCIAGHCQQRLWRLGEVSEAVSTQGPFLSWACFALGATPSPQKKNICSGLQVLELPLDLCKLCCNQKDVRANIVFKIVSPPTQTGNLGSASTHVDL